MATKNHTDSNVLDKQKETTQSKVPPKYNVILLNDDFTPFEFVTKTLMEIFGKDKDTADAIALLIHVKGKGICGTYVKDIAELKQTKTRQLAIKEEHPLQCVIEPAGPSHGNNGPKF